jgi:Fe2+ transport system protein FeoA
MGAKLIEMGFYPGKHVKVLFRAPFNGPFAIDAGGAVLSLREDEASLIETIDC